MPPVLSDRRALGLLMASTLTVMANATISPALPGLEAQFADHPEATLAIRMLVPAPSLTALICAPFAGAISDRIGRGRILKLAVLVYLLAGCAGMVLPRLDLLLLSRLLLGMAVAVIMTLQTALVGDFMKGAQRDGFVGAQVSARNLGGLVYVTLAGFLAGFAPQMAFAVYALTALYIPFIFAAADNSTPPQSRAKTIVWGRWLLPISALCLLHLLVHVFFFTMPTQLPFFIADQGYESALMTSLAMACLMVSGGVFAARFGPLHARIGARGVFFAGFGTMALGMAALSAWGYGMIVLGSCAMGAGYALLVPNITALVLRLAPEESRGLATGLITSAGFLGSVLSPLASTPLIAELGYAAAFQIAAAALAILTLGALGWRVTDRQILH